MKQKAENRDWMHGLEVCFGDGLRALKGLLECLELSGDLISFLLSLVKKGSFYPNFNGPGISKVSLKMLQNELNSFFQLVLVVS